MSDTPGSRLCRRCGLCCDGTLFGHVPVTVEEEPRLAHRLPILPATGELEMRFEQRCPALGPQGCEVYDVRPATCSGYRCKLLRRLDAGDTTVEAALEVVERVRAVAERLDRALPPGRNFHGRRMLMPEVGSTTSPEIAPIFGETWLDLKVLEILIERELRNPEPRAEEAATPV